MAQEPVSTENSHTNWAEISVRRAWEMLASSLATNLQSLPANRLQSMCARSISQSKPHLLSTVSKRAVCVQRAHSQNRTWKTLPACSALRVSREPSATEDWISVSHAGALCAQEDPVAAPQVSRDQRMPTASIANAGAALPRTAAAGAERPSTALSGAAEPRAAAGPSTAISGAVEPRAAGQSIAFAGAAVPSTAISGVAEPCTAAPGVAEPRTAISGAAELAAPRPGPGTREPSRTDLGASSEAPFSSALSVWRPSAGARQSPTQSTFSVEDLDLDGDALSVDFQWIDYFSGLCPVDAPLQVPSRPLPVEAPPSEESSFDDEWADLAPTSPAVPRTAKPASPLVSPETQFMSAACRGLASSAPQPSLAGNASVVVSTGTRRPGSPLLGSGAPLHQQRLFTAARLTRGRGARLTRPAVLGLAGRHELPRSPALETFSSKVSFALSLPII